MDIQSSNYIIFMFNHPNYVKTIHAAVYLPTAGLENNFIEELSKLEATLDILLDEHPEATIFLRGDANASFKPRKGNKRDSLFKFFCDKLFLSSSVIPHPTYHHFVGNTSSSIDVKLQKSSSSIISQEVILDVLCSKLNPNVDSKHDIILSSFSLPFSPRPNSSSKSRAPTIPNNKHKVVWNDEGILSYRDLLSPRLLSLRQNWNAPQSSVSFSVLLQCTNEALISAAKATNKVVDLTKDFKKKKELIPVEVSAAAKVKLEAHKAWLEASEDPSASEHHKSETKFNFKLARNNHRRLWRRHLSNKAAEQSSRVHSILDKDPSKAFKELKSLKSAPSNKISELKVGDKLYLGDDVAEGFFSNMKTLKTMSSETKNCTDCDKVRFDHDLIREISKHGDKIPQINLQKAEELLHSLKPHVCDHFNVSALHFINGGPHAIKHFQMLFNSAIYNIENTSCHNMNDAHAIVLFKGHKKDRSLTSSYSTISSCPFLAKSIDF